MTEITRCHAEMLEKELRIKAKEARLEQAEKKLAARDAELAEKDRENAAKDSEISAKKEELRQAAEQVGGWVGRRQLCEARPGRACGVAHACGGKAALILCTLADT